MPRAHSGTDAASTRERILGVALDLFVHKGYGETSLREIAAELGFSKAALYYHFESKQDLLLALHLRVHHVTDDVLPILRDSGSSDDVWQQLLDRLIGIALRNRRLLELHIRNSDAIGELHRGPGWQEKHGPIEGGVEEYLLELVRDPALPVEQRVRRTASLGAVAAVLLGASALADVLDAELETTLRSVVQDVLNRRPDEG